jgi:putative Holliday junction resolvase
MRGGVRLGIDVGDVRIGVARSDPSGLLAVPVETVARGEGDLDRLAALVAESEAVEVVVGLPVSLSGGEGPAAQKAREFARVLAERLGGTISVRLFDERLSTVSAQQGFHAQGLRTKSTRARIDQAAAAIILQSALDTERSTGSPPGSAATGDSARRERKRQRRGRASSE